jgi:hypothetical protein
MAGAAANCAAAPAIHAVENLGLPVNHKQPPSSTNQQSSECGTISLVDYG